MARPLRLQIQNGTYFIRLQGTEGMGLFVESSDSDHFLTLIDLAARKHHIRVYAFALAGNSAELMLNAPRGNPSAFTQALQTGFARHLHHHYVHQGPVMRGRYKSKLVDPATALVPLAAWIHSLPVRENPGLTRPSAQKAALHSARHTSLAAFLGKADPPGFLDASTVLKALGGRVNSRVDRFRELCETVAAGHDPEINSLLTASPLAIGSPEFIRETLSLHDTVRKGRGSKSLRIHGRTKKGIALGKIVGAVSAEFELEPKNLQQRTRNGLGRPALAFFLYNQGERSQSEIAKVLGLTSAAAVSLQIRRLIAARESQPELDKRLARVEKALEKLS